MKLKKIVLWGAAAWVLSAPVSADGLKVSYSFNNGTGQSGSGENVSARSQGYFPLSGSGSFEVTGRSGLALSQDVMVVGGLPPYSKDSPLTISMWVKPTIDAANGPLISQKHSEMGQGFSLSFDYDLNLVFEIVDEFGGRLSVATLDSLPLNNMWHHIAVTYMGDSNANNVVIYINDTVPELRLNANNLNGKADTFHPLVIGSGPDYKTATASSIDEIYLVPQAFNRDQITCLYQLKTDCAYRPTVGLQGPRGPQGEMGPAGVRGAEGIAGSVGITGPKGDVGPQGAQGLKGATGPKGFQGVTGPAGLDGADGVDGKDGLNGAVGLAGAPGDTGDTGPQGPAGPRGSVGAKGPTGDRGDQGPVGFEGITGPAGDQGPPGARGATGATGIAGAVGDKGPRGPAGLQGLPGVPGVPGDPGATGPRGPAGSNAQIGATGLKGDRGPQGDRGAAPTWCGDIYSLTASGQSSSLADATLRINRQPSAATMRSTTFKSSVDPTFILTTAQHIAADGVMEINFDVLAIETDEELQQFFAAANTGNAESFIHQLFLSKGLDNGFAIMASNLHSPLKPEYR